MRSTRDQDDAEDADADAADEQTELTHVGSRGSSSSSGASKHFWPESPSHPVMHTPLGESIELNHAYQEQRTHQKQTLPVSERD
jgi:hypothetical protein